MEAGGRFPEKREDDGWFVVVVRWMSQRGVCAVAGCERGEGGGVERQPANPAGRAPMSRVRPAVHRPAGCDHVFADLS
jgi:hypothetical protein